MAARDRFQLELECPKCGHVGIAAVSEDDHPYMKSPGFAFDKIPEGFSIIELSEYRQKNKLKCKCGQEFFA
jgi:hypothetical protein